jgi:hypothetical protein
MGCLSVVNTATSAIFTEGAWVSGVDGSSSWSDLQRENKIVTGREGQGTGEGF